MPVVRTSELPRRSDERPASARALYIARGRRVAAAWKESEPPDASSATVWPGGGAGRTPRAEIRRVSRRSPADLSYNKRLSHLVLFERT